MMPPAELLFDIETLVNSAQPRRILLLGDVEPVFLHDYCAQKALLNQHCEVKHLYVEQLEDIWQLKGRYDVGIVVNLLEHVEQSTANQVLSRLRDVLTPQYCVALPLSYQDTRSTWRLTDLFSFALSKVASYDNVEPRLTLFKYNIEDYKKTPDWLNANNWANPQLWGKYRW